MKFSKAKIYDVIKQIETGIVGMFQGFGNEDLQIAERKKELPKEIKQDGT